MKNKQTTLLAILIFSLAGCNREIDIVSDPDSARKILVGTWNSTVSGKSEGMDYCETYQTTRREDGTFTVQSVFIDHLSKDYTLDEYSGKWDISGTYYQESVPDSSVRFKIVELSKNELQIFLVEDFAPNISTDKIVEADIINEVRSNPSFELPKPPEEYDEL